MVGAACLGLWPSGPAHSAPAEEGAAAAGRKPNIIWLLLDACRAANLSCYGYERATSPHIDALARRGLLCEWHFAQSHCTNWSVSSYLTGRYFPVFALAFGSWRELWRTPPPEEQFLPQILADNGYHTALFSTTPWISKESRLWHTFAEQHFVSDRRRSLEAVNEVFFPWLDRHHDRPFFAYLHLLETHFPHWLDHTPPPHDQWLDPSHPRGYELSRYEGRGPREFSEADQAYLRGLHDGSIHYEDTHVGRLVERLRTLGILEDTVLIINADHGDALAEDGRLTGHYRGYIFEEVLRVPLVIAGPGFPKGRRIACATENADIVPTLVDALDLETKAAMHGRSLVPLFQDEDAPPPHEYIFARYQSDEVDDIPVFILRGKAYKYEWNALSGEEHLWRLPDKLGARVDCIDQNPERARAMRRVIEDRYLPMWRAYESLPRTSPCVFVEQFAPDAEPKDAWLYEHPGEETWNDNKWTLRGNFLASCGWQENAPPITVEFAVPNATFNVQLSVLNSSAVPPQGKPASSFLVQAEGAKPRAITVDSHVTKSSEWWTYADIGQYTVKDGAFTLTLDEGSPNHWSKAQRLRFIPVTAESNVASSDEASESEDQLRALGYLE